MYWDTLTKHKNPGHGQSFQSFATVYDIPTHLNQEILIGQFLVRMPRIPVGESLPILTECLRINILHAITFHNLGVNVVRTIPD